MFSTTDVSGILSPFTFCVLAAVPRSVQAHGPINSIVAGPGLERNQPVFVQRYLAGVKQIVGRTPRSGANCWNPFRPRRCATRGVTLPRNLPSRVNMVGIFRYEFLMHNSGSIYGCARVSTEVPVGLRSAGRASPLRRPTGYWSKPRSGRSLAERRRPPAMASPGIKRRGKVDLRRYLRKCAGRGRTTRWDSRLGWSPLPRVATIRVQSAPICL